MTQYYSRIIPDLIQNANVTLIYFVCEICEEPLSYLDSVWFLWLIKISKFYFSFSIHRIVYYFAALMAPFGSNWQKSCQWEQQSPLSAISIVPIRQCLFIITWCLHHIGKCFVYCWLKHYMPFYSNLNLKYP